MLNPDITLRPEKVNRSTSFSVGMEEVGFNLAPASSDLTYLIHIGATSKPAGSDVEGSRIFPDRYHPVNPAGNWQGIWIGQPALLAGNHNLIA